MSTLASYKTVGLDLEPRREQFGEQVQNVH